MQIDDIIVCAQIVDEGKSIIDSIRDISNLLNVDLNYAYTIVNWIKSNNI